MKKFVRLKWRQSVLMISAVCLPWSVSAQHVDEEIIVTATPGNESAGELAQSVTVVSGDELDRVRALNIGETLERQLGMSASYFGAGSSRPIIRGLAGARVLTLEDAMAAMDVSTISGDHAVGIDPLAARQVEIFRGPTTLLYGSGAVGGVVNTVTNRIPELSAEEGLSAVFELRGDTVADQRTLVAAVDGASGAWGWHFDAANRETGAYTIPQGRLANSDLDLESYAFGGSWLGSNALAGLAVSQFETNYGIPQIEAGGESVRIDLEQSRIDLKGNWLGSSGPISGINLRFGAADYQHVEIEGREIGTRFENDGVEGRVELLHVLAERWSGAFGLQLSERDFAAIGDEAFVPPVKTTSSGIFVVERFDSERWDLEFGARFESLEHRPTGASRIDREAVSVSVAAIRAFDDGYSLALNLASAERPPAAEELFADGPHLATDSIELGNASLRNETARHLDIGIRKSAGDLSWTITAFSTDYDDFIYLQDTGIIDPVEDLRVFLYSQQNAEFTGLEAEIFAPVAKIGSGEIDLRLFADFVRAKLDNGEKVPRIPPIRFGARADFHTDRFSVGFELTRYARQDDVAPNETPTAGYTLAGFNFNWLVSPIAGREFTVFLSGSNLLDEAAMRHTSLVKDIAPLPGRNLAFGFRAAL